MATPISEFGYFPQYSPNVSTPGFVVAKANVFQATDISTGVTANGSAGVITTQTATTAAENTNYFTVTNDKVKSDSVVTAIQTSYSGSYTVNGMPCIAIGNVHDGGFNIIVQNCHSTNALNGTLKIAFLVF